MLTILSKLVLLLQIQIEAHQYSRPNPRTRLSPDIGLVPPMGLTKGPLTNPPKPLE